MQTYFEYKIYGTEDELCKVLRDITCEINKKKDFRQLNYYNQGIHYNAKNNNFVLTYSNEECEELKCEFFDFEDMMFDLSRMFINLEINASAYIVDTGYFAKWHKNQGDIDYEMDDRLFVNITMQDYDKNDDTFKCYIDALDMETKIDANLFRNINKDFENKLINYNFNKFSLDVELEKDE